jgi:hypothetical protein
LRLEALGFDLLMGHRGPCMARGVVSQGGIDRMDNGHEDDRIGGLEKRQPVRCCLFGQIGAICADDDVHSAEPCTSGGGLHQTLGHGVGLRSRTRLVADNRKLPGGTCVQNVLACRHHRQRRNVVDQTIVL